MIAEASVAKGLTMKSFYRICVVLSTVLVLGNSHHQNYQQPRNYHDQQPGYSREWNQEPENLVHQRSTNYDQSAQSGLETENYQRIQQYPIEIDSFAPVNPNEASHHAQRNGHAHRIRQISMPIKDQNNHEGTRVIRLPPNGDPKDLKVMLIGTDNSTVYEESNVPDSVKEILARALAVNRGEAEIIHSESPVNEQLVNAEPVNTDPINIQAQSVNAQTVSRNPSRPLARLRPRNRRPGFKGPPNPAMAGFPFRRRRPFQRYPNIRGPTRRSNKNYTTNDKAKVSTVGNKTEAVLNNGVLPENGIKTTVTVIKPVDGKPENAEVKTTVEEIKFITKDGQPKVVAESIDKETTTVNDKDQNIFQADKYKSISLALDDNKPASQSDKLDKFDYPHVLPIKSLPAPAFIPLSGLIDKPVSTPKALVQPTLLDDVPTHPNAADTTATSNSVPKNFNDFDISPVLQTKTNILTSSLTLRNDDSIPIDTKLGKTLPKSDNEISIIASKTTLTESTSLPIQPENNNDVSTIVTEPTTIPNGDNSFVSTTGTPNTPSTTKSTPLPTNPNDGDDENDVFPTKLSKTLLTETDDVATTTVVSITVTEPTPTPPNPNEDDDSSIVSTTATDLTPIPTDINNSNDTADNNNYVIVLSTTETSPNVASTNQDLSKLSEAVTKPNKAPTKIITNESPVHKELVNAEPVNTQPIHAQTVGKTPSRPLTRLRPRNRRPGFKGPPNSAMVGYPHRRRRPFQRYPNIRGPARRPNKVFTSSNKAKAIKANKTETVLPESGIKTTVTVIKPVDGKPENAEAKTIVEKIENAEVKTPVEEIKFITKDAQPKVVSDFIDKETTIVSDKNKIIQADKIKSITPETGDKNINDDLHVAPEDKTYVLPNNAVKSVPAPVHIPLSGLIDKPVSTPKTLVQPILIDDVPTHPKAITITTSKSLPTNEVNISSTALQRSSSAIDIKLGKTLPESDDDISLSESKALPIPPKDNNDVPMDTSTTILSTTVIDLTPTPTILNGDDSYEFAPKLLESLFTTIDDTPNTPSTTKSTPLPTNPNDDDYDDDDDDVFIIKLSKTLPTESDDVTTTTVISTTVTEPTPTNPNEDDSVLFATKLIQSLLTTDNDDSFIVSTTTDLTPDPTDINNNDYTTDEHNSDVILSNAETASIEASTNQDNKFSQEVTKPTLAPLKSLKTDNVQDPDSSYSSDDSLHTNPPYFNELTVEVIENEYPYVIISRLPPEDGPTTEPSLFTTIIAYIIGNKENKFANIGVKDVKLQLSDGEHLKDTKNINDKKKIDEVSLTDNKDKISKSNTVTLTELKGGKILNQEKLALVKKSKKEMKVTPKEDKIIDEEDSEENTDIPSADVEISSEEGPLTPISFVVNLVRSALKGGDSLRALFSNQSVKEFLLNIFNVK